MTTINKHLTFLLPNSITEDEIKPPTIKNSPALQAMLCQGLLALIFFYVKSSYIPAHVTLSFRVVSFPLFPNGSMTAL